MKVGQIIKRRLRTFGFPPTWYVERLRPVTASSVRKVLASGVYQYPDVQDAYGLTIRRIKPKK